MTTTLDDLRRIRLSPFRYLLNRLPALRVTDLYDDDPRPRGTRPGRGGLSVTAVDTSYAATARLNAHLDKHPDLAARIRVTRQDIFDSAGGPRRGIRDSRTNARSSSGGSRIRE
ncbi:hypothetical protein [Streptomyces sp. NPDC003032]